MRDFVCATISGNPLAQRLVFSWDSETGQLAGRDAELVRSWAVPRAMVPAHPMPWGARLGRQPLRSKRDMALLIGVDHVVPEFLRAYYPKPPPDPQALAPNGSAVGTITF